MKKITKDWIHSAESDLLLIQEIIFNQHLTHLAAFHAQQAIEKSFKAIIEEFELGFIKSHSLETLYSKVKEKISTDINIPQLILLDQLYIEARYPGEMGLLPDGKPTIQDVAAFYNLAKHVFETAQIACI